MSDRLMIHRPTPEQVEEALRKQVRVYLKRTPLAEAPMAQRVQLHIVTLHQIHLWQANRHGGDGAVKIRAEVKPERCSVCLRTEFHERAINGEAKWICDYCGASH